MIGKCFCVCDGDFWVGMDVDIFVRFVWDCVVYYIVDVEDLCVFVLEFFYGVEGIGGFVILRDCEVNGVVFDDWILVL